MFKNPKAAGLSEREKWRTMIRNPKADGLRLAGRGEKIHEKVCRYGGRVPIREVWRARAMTAAVRRVLGLSETLGTCASSASNETRRS